MLVNPVSRKIWLQMTRESVAFISYASDHLDAWSSVCMPRLCKYITASENGYRKHIINESTPQTRQLRLHAVIAEIIKISCTCRYYYAVVDDAVLVVAGDAVVVNVSVLLNVVQVLVWSYLFCDILVYLCY